MSKSSPKLRPNLFDGIVVLAVALLAIVTSVVFYGGLGGKQSAVTAVVLHYGEEVARVDLSKLDGEKQIAIDGEYHLTVTLTAEGAQMTHSDCPTQDCVRTGHIRRVGQSIICLPEQVVVKLEGAKQSGDPDLILG